MSRTGPDPDGFETISRNMIEYDEIRTQVAAQSVDTLFENVDVEAAIAERLPPPAGARAGSGRSRALGRDRAADAALERPRVQTVWVEATTRTQRQLVRLIDDDTTFIQTEGGAVVLDLRPIVIELGDQVAVIGKVAESMPESGGGSRSSRSASRDGTVDHEVPARRRGLDVARRARGRCARGRLARGVADSISVRSRSACSSWGC